MSKYKVGDKVILTVTSTNEMGCLPCYVLNDDLILSKQDIDKYTEPLSAYTEPLEAKIRRQAAEITRLLRENKGLKEDFEKGWKEGFHDGYIHGLEIAIIEIENTMGRTKKAEKLCAILQDYKKDKAGEQNG